MTELLAKKDRGMLCGAELRQLADLEAKERRGAYLRSLEKKRADLTGKSGKQTKAFQAAAYAALGLDLQAGYDGRPPTFLPDQDINEATAGGKGFRNAVRDPLALLHRKGSIDDGQYKAANDYIALREDYEQIGGRAINYGERVDGGRAPDFLERQSSIGATMDAFRRHMGDHRMGLLDAACIGGNALYVVAQMGRWGRDHRTVLKVLRAALDHAGRFFG
ncbi:hypothetical protein [uncultured Alsobacter sp.]|uniref:hypothetical protein n=1 Tax=uncultured Alsobacter sp. TaxID=1748258 RepID=UPI0025F26D6A|nr:hypothetical protein [uncultured Alsobacter sp.]